MIVNVKVTSFFKRYTEGHAAVAVEISPVETAFDAAVRAGIPRNEIGFISVKGEDGNDQLIDESYSLSDGITIFIYPR